MKQGDDADRRARIEDDVERLRPAPVIAPVSWWRAVATDQWVLRPDQEPEQPAPDVERIVQLVRFAEGCEDGWRRWFASTGIQPCEVVYEDLARDRLGIANRVRSAMGTAG